MKQTIIKPMEKYKEAFDSLNISVEERFQMCKWMYLGRGDKYLPGGTDEYVFARGSFGLEYLGLPPREVFVVPKEIVSLVQREIADSK